MATRTQRPCIVCGEDFEPHPRAGRRQKACRKESCQRERHRRNCERWHAKNPGYDWDLRARKKLNQAREKKVAKSQDTARKGMRSLGTNPLDQVPWDAARDLVGSEMAVLMADLGEQLVQWVRDSVEQEVALLRAQVREIALNTARDAIASGGLSP